MPSKYTQKRKCELLNKKLQGERREESVHRQGRPQGGQIPVLGPDGKVIGYEPA